MIFDTLYQSAEAGLVYSAVEGRSPTLSPYSTRFVHDGARLDFDKLQEMAHRLLSNIDYTQQALDDRLDMSRISVARAVTEPGPK
jgi:hypothetical protein